MDLKDIMDKVYEEMKNHPAYSQMVEASKKSVYGLMRDSMSTMENSINDDVYPDTILIGAALKDTEYGASTDLDGIAEFVKNTFGVIVDSIIERAKEKEKETMSKLKDVDLNNLNREELEGMFNVSSVQGNTVLAYPKGSDNDIDKPNKVTQEDIDAEVQNILNKLDNEDV